MLKKSCAIILSIALAVDILVHGSFAYDHPGTTTPDSILSAYSTNISSSALSLAQTNLGRITSAEASVVTMLVYSRDFSGITQIYPDIYMITSQGKLACNGSYIYSSVPNDTLRFNVANRSNQGTALGTGASSLSYTATFNGVTYYRCTWSTTNVQSAFIGNKGGLYSSEDFWYNTTQYTANLDISSYLPYYMDVYMSGSTYGGVKYLCIEVDDIILSSSWISVHFYDTYGNSTYIKDYPFDFFTANGHSYIKVYPNYISNSEFTVTSVIYSGSSSWGVHSVSGLSLTFNESVLPSLIPSVSPAPEYWYYDTTYINYNGGDTTKIYDCFNTTIEFRVPDGDSSPVYIVDSEWFLRQPFSFTYIAIPRFSPQYFYDSFLDDVIYQYDVVFDELYNSMGIDLAFDNVYGSGMYQDLLSAVNTYFTQTGSYDLSPVFESWYSDHNPLCYQFPYDEEVYVMIAPLQSDCSLIISDSFYFKQTNYLLGDTGDILSELSERLFKEDGFSALLFQNMSALYNLNLEYFDSSLQALTGLSYWLNENDISSSLSDIAGLLTSVDSYLSSVDGKLDYLVTIDSDLNDLLEWFQNQEDSDVILTLPDFNPTILIELYGQNIGDLIDFFQGFVNVLPDFDFSDFPNFFDYAADLVDDVAGQDDDIMNDLFQPYDYSDSGLHEFGWD